jgi:GNAT superfamily N-acetyltransferase
MADPAYDLRPIDLDDAGIRQVTALLARVFPDAEHFTEAVVRWQYVDNPDGNAVGFNAWAGNELSAHYVTIPLRAVVFGHEEKGLLSLNTATAPEHQGRGLFTKLARATYDRAAEQGYTFVVGVANANSTHGFTKKLGFQLVSPLRAMVGVGRVPLHSRVTRADFAPVLDASRLAWRTAHPAYRYTLARDGHCTYVLSERTMKGFHFLLYATLDKLELPALPMGEVPWRKAYIGLGPEIDWSFAPYLNVPMRVRPSPLNLIFKDLTGKGRTLDATRVRFQAVDFDTL